MITYRIPQADVSAEVFDQEVLAIHLTSGHYHSFREAGVQLWNLLTNGHSVETAAAALAAATDAPLSDVLADARGFVDVALANGLLVAVEAPDAPVPSVLLRAGPYVSPVLEHYSDMQELLLIDPVHEVDVSGWPRRPGA
jgi:hypothetical protein